jgi:outer membrane receptor for ferrienterochelin and colicin
MTASPETTQQMETVTKEDIERLHVSGALGGVINIITKKKQGAR